MKDDQPFDVIIVGGSYSGLAAGMALGRALKKVLIMDDGKPCNRQTPYSHNFLTQDGKTPKEIATLARQQVESYNTVSFSNCTAAKGIRTKDGFELQAASGASFKAKKLIFATGIRDQLPAMEGLAACWGISVLHCPYCHGYEVSHAKTGILGNGESGFDFVRLISNWTNDLTLFTNGPSALNAAQTSQLGKRAIRIIENEIERLEHRNGYLQHIIFRNGRKSSIEALYAAVPFEQQCPIPESLGCSLTGEGYIQIDPALETTVQGVFACGDNASRMRTVANAVAMGTTAGMILSKQMILEAF